VNFIGLKNAVVVGRLKRRQWIRSPHKARRDYARYASSYRYLNNGSLSSYRNRNSDIVLSL